MTLFKRLIPAVVLSAGLVGLLGCEETKIETSDVLHEDAVVSETIYSPSQHSSSVSPGYNFGRKGGFTMQVTSVNIPQKYAVVFKCQHGKFISEGTDERHKKLWEKLSPGQEVDVTYKEIYRTTYDDKDKDGKKEVINRVLINYDFLDANKKPAKLNKPQNQEK